MWGETSGPTCLLTRRKSPTRRVGSMDAEGMRKGCTVKVMMNSAMIRMFIRDWNACSSPWRCAAGAAGATTGLIGRGDAETPIGDGRFTGGSGSCSLPSRAVSPPDSAASFIARPLESRDWAAWLQATRWCWWREGGCRRAAGLQAHGAPPPAGRASWWCLPRRRG